MRIYDGFAAARIADNRLKIRTASFASVNDAVLV